MSQPSTARQDRIRVSQACEHCREKKSKCDGVKPVCGRCRVKHLDCNYGVTKRIRNQQVMKELATKVAQYETLLKRSIPIQTSVQDQSAATQSNTSLDPDSAIAELTLSDSYSQDGLLDSVHGTSRRQSDAAQSSEPDMNVDTDLEIHSQIDDPSLPSRALLEQGIDAFFEATAVLFNFFDQDEVFILFDDVYTVQNPARFRVSLVQLCAAAAVGCRFFPQRFDVDSHVTLISAAKDGIEQCIEEASLPAMRALALLTMYFTFEKRTAALMYVDMGLRLAKLHRHETMIYEQSLTVWQGVFVSLIFLDCWLCSTTGHMPTSQTSELHLPMIIMDTTDASVNTVIQFEMIKIAALNASILQDVYHARFVSSATVTGYKNQLQQWLMALPAYMRLDRLVNLGERPEYLRPIVLLHLLYMSTVILVYRRILNDLASLGRHLSDPDTFHKTQQFLEPCVWTGRQVAKLLEITLSQNQLLQTCWITASATYSTCNLLLYSVAIRLVQSDLTHQLDQDMAAAQQCIKILTHCGHGCEVAGRYLTNATTLCDSITQVIAILTSKPSSEIDDEESARTNNRLLRLMSLAARYLIHPFDGGYPREVGGVHRIFTSSDSTETEIAISSPHPSDVEMPLPGTERAMPVAKDGIFLNDLMHEQSFINELRAHDKNRASHGGLQRLSFSPPRSILFGS